MPAAGGESYRGVAGFYPYVKAESVDIIMPDVKVRGGTLEVKKIAAMAEGAGLLTAPHGPASPVGNASAAHVVATLASLQHTRVLERRSSLVRGADTSGRGRVAGSAGSR